MARKFTYTNVAALEVGESLVLSGEKYGVANRRIRGYASRCKPAPKSFVVTNLGMEGVRVTRTEAAAA